MGVNSEPTAFPWRDQPAWFTCESVPLATSAARGARSVRAGESVVATKASCSAKRTLTAPAARDTAVC